MKLKLNTSQANNSTPQQPESAVKTPGLKINFNQTPTTAQPASTQKAAKPTPKGKGKKATSKATGATSKKRGREDDDDADEVVASGGSASKKQARQGSMSIKLNTQQAPPQPMHIRTHSIKLSSSKPSALTPKTPTGMTRLKINKKGNKPPRPLGVGYDSDAEDAEDDPAIEENIVLRMLPGPDAELLRRAIDERTIGVPLNQGGADVRMRFFAKEPRRAAVCVQDRVYSAVLVDLPCVVESMKSWDRRGWWKSADICQMWLVTGRVNGEEEAQEAPLPREMDVKTWQWPHGLTPPMHNVRKRRFRKRVSYRTIEAAEDEVERLLAADREVKKQKGRSTAEVVDLEALRQQEVEDEEEYEEAEEQDGEGDVGMFEEGGEYANGDEPGDCYDEDDAEDDAEAVAARIALELGADMGIPGSLQPDPASAADAFAPTTTPAEPTPEGATGNAAPTPAAEEEESDEDEDEDEAEEQNEEELEKARMRAQQREEVAHLQNEVETTKQQLSQTLNPLLRQRYEKRIESFEKDLANKKRNLGDEDDG